jgi:hypothetical protein
MLCTNQITKIRNIFFWPNQTIPEVVHGGGLDAISKYFLVLLGKSPIANETCFLISEMPKFMMTLLSESASGKTSNLIISKSGIFGVFTIIDRIHIGIPL